MIQMHTIDELERSVAIAELRANTIELAFHIDDEALISTERLAVTIGNSLQEHLPLKHSPVVPHLIALKVRVGATLDRLREIQRQRVQGMFHDVRY
jgi:hypothetical protein